MNTPLFRSERKSTTQCLTLTNDATRNALTHALIGALRNEIETASADDTVRAVLVAHEGATFSSGHNFIELQGLAPSEAKNLFTESCNLMLAIRRCSVPVVAALGGGALGAGCQLALSCDAIVASPQAYFATPGGAKGWFCFTPAVPLGSALPRPIAFEMLVAGLKLSAERAFSFGLVNRLVAHERLGFEAIALCDSLSQGSREMVKIGKERFLSRIVEAEKAEYLSAAETMASTLFSPSAQGRIRGYSSRS